MQANYNLKSLLNIQHRILKNLFPLQVLSVQAELFYSCIALFQFLH